MNRNPHSHRRAGRGTLIVRASVVACLAASVGLQFAEPEHKGRASWTAGNLSVLCAVDPNGSFAFQ